jgi:hypothetical protein
MPPIHECECKKPDIRDELMKMSLEDLTDFIEYSQKIMETRKRELYDKARMEFIKAYLNYRQVCSTDTAYITIEDEDAGNIEIDLYEYLDFYLEHEA